MLFDTELDTYPMPDPSMSMEHLTEAGYTENDLLPLSLDTAELMYGSDFTVYLIRPGENPEWSLTRRTLITTTASLPFPARNGRPARILTMPSRTVSVRRNSRGGRRPFWTTRGIASPSISFTVGRS